MSNRVTPPAPPPAFSPPPSGGEETSKKAIPHWRRISGIRPWLGPGVLLLLVVATDQLTKTCLAPEAVPGGERRLLGGLVRLVPRRLNRGLNLGVGDSWFRRRPGAATAVAAVGLFWGLMLLWALAPRAWRQAAAFRAGCALIAGGGLSNLLDRLACGGVRDWLALCFYPFAAPFNLADGVVMAGLLLLCGAAWRGRHASRGAK